MATNLKYRQMTISEYIDRIRRARICGMEITLMILARMWGVVIAVITDQELWLSANVDSPDNVHIILGTQRGQSFYSTGLSF